MRYEAHRMIVSIRPDEEPLDFGGFFAAAMMAVSLVHTDEGDARGITLDSDETIARFFDCYEDEVLRDDWGYLRAEQMQLHDVHVQLAVSTVTLRQLCPNARLLTLLMRLVESYMHRLVIEEFGEHIWDRQPWKVPFAQWLWSAVQLETIRQRYLHTNWFDAATVMALADAPGEEQPTFFFEGEKAEDILSRYFQWLSTEYEAQTKEFPGAQITGEDREYILSQETDFAFLNDELSALSPEQRRLWQQWLDTWSDFIRDKLAPATPGPAHKKSRQELFLDTVLPVPQQNSYAAVREYIRERSKYDKEFQKFVQSRKRTELCDQLSSMFGWYVDPNSLGKSLNRRLKHPKKSHLQ